jgi:ParB-like chromosome segregation protein Spo0J
MIDTLFEQRIIPISEVNPAPYNPRLKLEPGDREYERLKGSLERWGLVAPLVWNQRNGNLVGGHQRFTILVNEGSDRVPVTVVDLDDEAERALNVALNKATGDWNKVLLAQLADSFDEATQALLFDQSELDGLMGRLTRDAPDAPPEFPTMDEENVTGEYRCPHCAYEWSGPPRPDTGIEFDSGDAD